MTLLESYPQLTKNRRLTLTISGNRPEASKYQEYPDFIQFDHQDFKKWPSSNENIALLSLPFYKFSLWKGDSPLPEKDRIKLQEAIEAAHERSLPIRFWATPDTALAWETLQELGVDFINTDRPYDCVNFLKQFE
jgi:alkaline phosphatase